jgi:signal transduction histidine kinase
MWQVSVGDNGIGIDVDQHERVFQLFRRAHPGYDGMGLGLAICQRIVERHGGEIWVEAGPAGGSMFHFTVPDRYPAGPAAARPAIAGPETGGPRTGEPRAGGPGTGGP